MKTILKIAAGIVIGFLIYEGINLGIAYAFLMN